MIIKTLAFGTIGAVGGLFALGNYVVASDNPQQFLYVSNNRVIIEQWIDGDTVQTSGGRIRLIGIDTADVERCPNYKQMATEHAESLAPAGTEVIAVRPESVTNKDKYKRFLRYVVIPSTFADTDMGMSLLNAGLADARYDSRDGYDWHPLEDRYREGDEPGNINEKGLPVCPLPVNGEGEDQAEEDEDDKNRAARAAAAAAASDDKSPESVAPAQPVGPQSENQETAAHLTAIIASAEKAKDRAELEKLDDRRRDSDCNWVRHDYGWWESAEDERIQAKLDSEYDSCRSLETQAWSALEEAKKRISADEAEALRKQRAKEEREEEAQRKADEAWRPVIKTENDRMVYNYWKNEHDFMTLKDFWENHYDSALEDYRTGFVGPDGRYPYRGGSSSGGSSSGGGYKWFHW